MNDNDIKSIHTKLNRKRVRPELLNVNIPMREKKEYQRRVYLSGRKKREYMLQSALTGRVVVNGNHLLLERVNERLAEMEPKLHALIKGEQNDEPVLEELRTIYELTENWE
jgi:hypothetical protein